MAYTKQNFVDKQTVLTAAHMENIEDAICDLDTSMAEVVQRVNELADGSGGKIVSFEVTENGGAAVVIETHADGTETAFAIDPDANGNPESIDFSDGTSIPVTWVEG